MGRRVAVVGGGAAGILAALALRRAGAEAVVFERNPRVGIKIRISGGGKCNVTHAGTPREIESGFIQREARFLRHALHTLPPTAILSMLDAEGVALYTRPNGRVFPESGQSEEVLTAFESMMDRAAVSTAAGSAVAGLHVVDARACGVVLEGGSIERFDAVIVTTGGVSYPTVGTTGDGIRWGEQTGHVIEPLRAALAPIYLPHSPPKEWQGVALRDVLLRVEGEAGPPLPRNEPYPASWRDDLLLTHRGVSGPAALETSRAAARALELGTAPTLVVDMQPDAEEGAIERSLVEQVAGSGRTEIQNVLVAWMPRAIVPAVLASAGVPHGRQLAELTRPERRRIAETVRGWRIGAVGNVPIERGEVSAGGIALGEVDPRTMASRRVPGLFFAGEVLDIAGSVGGYNLQAAFSTGWVAGTAAAG